MADLTPQSIASMEVESSSPPSKRLHTTNFSSPSVIGIIGGSLLAQLPGIQSLQPVQVTTTEGPVNLRCGRWQQLHVVFCHRHLADPSTSYSQPRHIPFRAIALAMQCLHVDVVLGIYSVGSLKEGLRVGSLVFPHDYWNIFDIQHLSRDPSAHVIPTLHEPFRSHLITLFRTLQVPFQEGGVYVQSSGPRFETKAEIKFYSMIGDMVGMTGANECELFTELRIPFGMLAMVDNYANGISGELAIGDLHDGEHRHGLLVQEAISKVLDYYASECENGSKPGEVVDLIVYAKHVVPVEPINVILDEHAVVVQEGRIVEILPWKDARQKYEPLEVANMMDHVVFPGFVNAHTHASMTLMRGLADDKPLCEWLAEDIWPAEAKFVSPEFVKHGTQHSVAEMIRGGTTCYNDMYFYPETSAKVLEEIGMRAVLGQIVLEFPTQYASNAADYLEKAIQVHQRVIESSTLVRSAMAPHAPYTVSDQSLIQIEQISKERNWPIHLHLHETKEECDDSENLVQQSMNCHKSTHRSRPLQNLNRLGLLSERLIAVHMTQLSDEEIKLVAASKTNVVHCPSSNLKLAAGVCRVTELLDAGVNVAIGTDSASSNNSLNMFAEMKLAAILAKASSKQCTSVPAAMALRMATLNGAIALGMGKETGSLEVGKWADMAAVKLNCIELMPMYCVISHLVYSAGRENVSDVWIAGKRVLRERKLTTIDEKSVLETCRDWYHNIRDFHDELLKAKAK